MALIHKGIRPKYGLDYLDDGRIRKTYLERRPDGITRMWNLKLLNNGCGKVLTSEMLEDGDLLYCEHCEEWFNKNQFTES